MTIDDLGPGTTTPTEAVAAVEAGTTTAARRRADRGAARGAAVRRGAAAEPARDRAARGRRPRDRRRPPRGSRGRARARGIRLVLSGDRVELATAPEAGALIARYVGADAVRLSPAALETLAIVAYRQPVTKGAIERIRGVDSDYTVRALIHRRLVVEQGRSEAPGRPILYGTGFEFLERFGLTSLEELPLLDLDIAARLVDGDGDEAAPRRSTATG